MCVLVSVCVSMLACGLSTNRLLCLSSGKTSLGQAHSQQNRIEVPPTLQDGAHLPSQPQTSWPPNHTHRQSTIPSMPSAIRLCAFARAVPWLVPFSQCPGTIPAQSPRPPTQPHGPPPFPSLLWPYLLSLGTPLTHPFSETVPQPPSPA